MRDMGVVVSPFGFLLWICTFLKAKYVLFCKLSAGSARAADLYATANL